MNQRQSFHPPTEKALSRLSRTTGQEVLFLLAIAFVAGFGWWWYQAWSTLITPPSLLSTQGMFTVMISAVYALVVPLFGSMLLPNSPAGWLLQQQTWAYPGQLAVLIATIILAFFGGRTMYIWLLSQNPVLQESGMFYPAIAAALIGAYLVPALQFAYMTPTQQLIRIQQAHEIRKLKIMYDGEVAVLESRLQWLAVVAAGSAAELLPATQQEVTATLRGLFKGQSDINRRLLRLMDVKRDAAHAMGLMTDVDIDTAFDYVEDALFKTADYAAGVLPVPESVFSDIPHPQAAPAAPPRPAPPRPAAAPAAQRGAAPRYAAELQQAQQELTGMWTPRQLGDALGKSDRTARDWIAAWEEVGVVARGETRGAFYFTESEAHNGR